MSTSKRLHSRDATPTQDAPSSPSQALQPLQPPHPLPKFLDHHLLEIHQKFKTINAHEASLRTNPSAIISHPIAYARNRYPDIHPWSHNRIHLHSLPFPYINASPINLGRPKENFIATQGPMESGLGIDHFWEMVWQERCEVIVMLTQAWEEGREKCSVYYPEALWEIKELEGWGSVQCVGFSHEFRTEIRELKVTKKSVVEGVEMQEERAVWHFLFLGWPDQEVPRDREDQKALLELIKMSRFRIEEISDGEGEKETPPRVVHCSAGVGRTGTFIALDHLLQELEDGRFDGLVDDNEADREDSEAHEVDPVFETVKKLREQRMFMVYKPGQYAFIYQILKERWQARMKGGQGPSVSGESRSNGDESQMKKRKLIPSGSDIDLNSDAKKGP